MQEHMFDAFLRDAQYDASTFDVTLSNEQTLLYPYFDIITKAAKPTVVFGATVTTGDQVHNVFISYCEHEGLPDLWFWCGDKTLEGYREPEHMALIVRQTAEALEDPAHAYKWNALDRWTHESNPPSAKVVTTMKLLMSNYGAYPRPPASQPLCNFWRLFRGGSSRTCSHVGQVLATLRDKRPDFKNELKRRYQEFMDFAAVEIA